MQRSTDRHTSNAAVHERGGKYFVFPLDKTSAGVYLYGKPVRVLLTDTSDEKIGDAVVEALGSSKIGISHPVDPDRVPPLPLYEAAGVKSWSTFARGALYCDLQASSGFLKIVPSRKDKGSFLPLPEDAVTTAYPAAPHELGAAIRLALSRCE